jgi:NADPH2:quinone reductase
VINYTKNNYVDEVAKITQNAGVGIVYDSVGGKDFDKSLQCLWPMGICISFGESAGKIEKIDLDLMFIKSLYLTRPMMPLYKSQRVELAMSAEEIFSAVARGIIRLQITEFDFKDVAKAHKALENRETTGSLVLKVN